jgi:uncharacterized delta-60 repeat protein
MRRFLLVAILAALAAAAPAYAKQDFGDAPDGHKAGYDGSKKLANVVGRFPSKKSSDGASHKKPGKLLLGAKVTSEGDSNQVDRDGHDDGFAAVVRECERVTYRFVIDASGLPNQLIRRGNARLNVWADWNQDGDWRDRARCGKKRVPEWVISNKKVKLASFAAHPVQDITVEALAGDTGPHLWMRASVTDSPFKKRIEVDGRRIRNDGRGRFRFGETEDSFAYVNGPIGPREEDEEKEVVECRPASQALTHTDEAVVSVVFVDEAGDPIAGRASQPVLQGAPPLDWKVETFPGGIGAGGQLIAPGANVGFKVHNIGLEIQTLDFQVKSNETGKSYFVSCELRVFHGKPGREDFGDAPDDVSTVFVPSLRPLCEFSRALFGQHCSYPSKADHGPSHLNPNAIHLGVSVDEEGDSRQINAEGTDDGFDIVRLGSCERVTFRWMVVLEDPADAGRKQRRLLRALIEEVETGRAKIFLNAWYDADNSGDWRSGSRCPGSNFPVSENPVKDSKLTKDELAELAATRFDGGRRFVAVERTSLVGKMSSLGPGCWRGTVSAREPGKRFSLHTYRGSADSGGVSGVHPQNPFSDGSVLYPYNLGETEDVCPTTDTSPPDDPPTDVPGDPPSDDPPPGGGTGDGCTPSGSPDTSFGTGGIVHPVVSTGADNFGDMVRQSDGKVVGVGSDGNGDAVVARFNADGSFDSGFGSGGIASGSYGTGSSGFQSVALQSDGKILAAGSASQAGTDQDFLVARFNSNGTPDMSYGGGDGVSLIPVDPGANDDSAFDLALQSDDKVVVAGRTFNGVTGTDAALVRLDTSGAPDGSFDGDGIATYTGAGGFTGEGFNAVTILPGGTILAAGGSSNDFLVFKASSAGAPVGSFGSSGVSTLDFGAASEGVNDIVVNAGDGRIIVVGFANGGGGGTDGNAAVGVLNANGTPDTGFSGDGKLEQSLGSEEDAFEAVLIHDGKILALGIAHKQGTKVRYRFDGGLDTLFGGGDGIAEVPKGSGETAQRVVSGLVLPDGRILVGGSSVPASGVLADWFLEVECP